MMGATLLMGETLLANLILRGGTPCRLTCVEGGGGGGGPEVAPMMEEVEEEGVEAGETTPTPRGMG